MLAEENVTRVAGPHCYAFYAGEEAIAAMMEEEPGTFFVTDFLVPAFRSPGDPRPRPRPLPAAAQ